MVVIWAVTYNTNEYINIKETLNSNLRQGFVNDIMYYKFQGRLGGIKSYGLRGLLSL